MVPELVSVGYRDSKIPHGVLGHDSEQPLILGHLQQVDLGVVGGGNAVPTEVNPSLLGRPDHLASLTHHDGLGRVDEVLIILEAS